METPAKPARPFAASTIPLDGSSPSRTRLMDLESTRKQAMDQMEGAVVEKLQPTRRSTGSELPDPNSTAPRQQEQPTQQYPPQRLTPNQQQQQSQPLQGQWQQQQQPSGSSQEKILTAILAADDNYVPSDFAAEAAIPGALLQEVEGVPLIDYTGEETVYNGSTVNVYGESSLSIPVKVTVPGSIVSYTIERRSSDFWFGVLSQDGSDQVETVKVRSKLRYRHVYSSPLMSPFVSFSTGFEPLCWQSQQPNCH
jgi:hypothetical protein